MFTALMPMVSGQLAGLSGKVTAGQLTSNCSWAMLYRSILGRALYDHQAHAYYYRDIYKPAVGFNYILLDEQFNYVPEGSGFMDAENNATLQTLATGLMVVKKSGYLTVTTTVGTPSFNAYFDNLSILHRSGPLLQESDTYAFGGGIDALESRSFGRAENKYGYNGKEKQPDLGLEWLDYGARMYDAQVGRWGCVDPLAEAYLSFGSYVYGVNNPIRYIDPNGMAVEEINGGVRYTEDDAKSAFLLLSGKSSNVFITVEANENDRKSISAKDKAVGYGNWAVFAVENLKKAALALAPFADGSISNLVLANHGAANKETGDSYFCMTDKPNILSDLDAVTTSEIRSYNEKKGEGVTKGEEQAKYIADIGKKVTNKGNFIMSFCYTGSGVAGQSSLQAVSELTGNRFNIYMPVGLTNTPRYRTSLGLMINFDNKSLSHTKLGWQTISPSGSIKKIYDVVLQREGLSLISK